MWNNYYGTSSSPSYPFTNVAYVTSLEEALIRTTQFNSDMIYFNQDKNEFYRIRVDNDGRKSYLSFVYTLPVPPTQEVQEDKFVALLARVEALEKLVKTEANDGKPNG